MDVVRPGCQLCSYTAHPAQRQPSCSSPQARAIFISFYSVAKDVPPSLSRTLINLSSGPVLFLSNYPITLRLWIPSQETSRESINCKGEYLHLCIYLLITKSMWHTSSACMVLRNGHLFICSRDQKRKLWTVFLPVMFNQLCNSTVIRLREFQWLNTLKDVIKWFLSVMCNGYRK